MKIQVFSDLHFDAAPGGWAPELAPGTDVVVCAGDVCEGLNEACAYLRAYIPTAPIVMVAGNHSFYGRCHPHEIADGREAAAAYGIHLLEDDAVIIDGVRFVGTTLWTDYRVFGENLRWQCMDIARRGLNDHRKIKWSKEPWLRFRPEEAATLHAASVSYLRQVLAVPFDGPTVVVTHHAPLAASISQRYAKDLLSAAYASDLSMLIARTQPELWVHGHVHESFDYQAGDTRVICNPHGYGRENVSGFNPALVVELGP